MEANRKSPDANLPVWFDGKNINEALFCEEFLREHRIIFTNRAFFTPDGRVADDLSLRGEIYEELKCCAVNSIPQKISNILEVLKLEAQVEDFPPEPDCIHLANGTLLLDGTFTEGRPRIVRNRLPVAYRPDVPSPTLWLRFLDNLIHQFSLWLISIKTSLPATSSPDKSASVPSPPSMIVKDSAPSVTKSA